MEAAAAQSFQSRTFSIKLWPPSQSTRSMLVDRMAKNLSTESIFSRKYGLLSKEEAGENAERIEASCFAAADAHFEKEPDGDGSAAVQFYAKETSKLMLEVLKRGPTVVRETVLDISGGRRDFIETEETKELLSPLTKEGNWITKICFSNRSFGIGAARAAEPILVAVKGQLKEVDLSDFIAGRPEDEALEVMRIFSSALEGSALRYLNLSDNALGEKGVRSFGILLESQRVLEELYLMNDGISEEAARALCDLIPSTDKLKILHFHNNMTGDEGAVAISEVIIRSLALEDFRCSSTRVGSEGGIPLAEALGNCSHLKRLDLRDNIFGVEAGVTLSKSLEKLSFITELYLSYLNLEDEGAIAISDALKNSAPALEILEIAGNDITAKSAPSLAQCVASKKSLKKLSLAENELEDEGAVIIGEALEPGNEELRELDLSSNMIRRAGARCLARAVVSGNKPDFVLLNINGNAISDDGIDEVREILKARKDVDVLGPLDENGDGDDEEEDEDGGADEDDGLEAKLQNLTVEDN